MFYGREKELAKLEKEYLKSNSFCSIMVQEELKKIINK